MAARSSVGVAPASWAAAVEPADVPMVRSAVVTSSPASKRPAMTPISHALPVDPPPPRTNARSPAAGAGPVASEAAVEVRRTAEEGVVFMELLPVRSQIGERKPGRPEHQEGAEHRCDRQLEPLPSLPSRPARHNPDEEEPHHTADDRRHTI